MTRKEKAKTIALRLLITVLCVVFGILISGQLRSIPNRVTNPIAPYSSLKETREDLYKEQEELKLEIKRLQSSIADAQGSLNKNYLSEIQLESLSEKKAQAGLTNLNGPGIIIIVDDGKVKPTTEDTIVHAADLRDIVNLLWGSGAEAIAINNQRIVVNSAIDCIVNTIMINNMRLTNPFQIEAIGNKELMRNSVDTSFLLSGIQQRVRKGEINFSIKTNNDITVPMFDGSFEVGSRTE